MTDKVLLPCPACESEVVAVGVLTAATVVGGSKACCGSCGVCGPERPSEPLAAQAWNDMPRALSAPSLTSPVERPAEEGWVEWNGGKCPVADDVEVTIRRRGGELIERVDRASEFNWGRYDRPMVTDIIAYRVLPTPSDPYTEAQRLRKEADELTAKSKAKMREAYDKDSAADDIGREERP